MSGEIIIADTISVRTIQGDIYEVAASVMGANQTREQAKRVSVRWNSLTGSANAQSLLIAAFQAVSNPPEDVVKNQLIEDIGTVIPS